MKKRIILFPVVMFLLFSCQNQPPKKALKKPNVLFILVDDYGYTDCSVMGSKYYETPNVDRIANEGMIFTDGYAACRVCSPSRASIISGKFPARHGITDWIGAKTGEAWSKKGRATQLLPPEYKHTLALEYTTLPEAMKEAGYKTFFAGKWHIGGKGSWPEDHGFDINKGGWDAGSPHGGYFSPYKNPNLENGPDGENLSMRLANETVDFIKNNQDTAFFAYLSFYAVHGPIQTVQEKWAKYRDKAEAMGIAETGFKMGHFLPIRQSQDNPVYAGLVEAMDDAVGVVLDALKEMNLDENTIICFTGDNGGVVAGDAYATSNFPLRGGKGYQFEGGIREPFFINVPGLGNGQRCNTPVSGTDFYPTLLELVGAQLKPEEHTDGVSLVPLLKGESIEERPLIWHYPHYGNQGGEPSSVIREGDWKLIHYYEDGHEELYHLKDDLGETNDLASENSERVKQMSTKLFEMLNEMGARFPAKDPTWTAEREKKHLNNVINKQMPKLEKQRLKLLSKDFDPGNNWWGSMVTKD
ncbi:sulfatase [Saccharicrinis sp. 156]|uniref:sulfatase n=1 Tax=Saccharicrinis sp. 156 TaxID=3417574 RepID=UPI003D32EDF3